MADLAKLVLEIETRGGSEAKRELDQMAASADKAAVSVDKLEDATRDVGTAAQSMSAAVSRSTSGVNALGQGATRVSRAANDVETGSRRMASSADVVTNRFGLAAHQVTSFGSQIVDLGVQISSGQGILLPLVQQGPQAVGALGGVGRAAEIAKTAIKGIGPAGLVAFGTAGIVGGITAAAAALLNFNEDLKRTEAAVRTLNGAAGQGIIDRSKASAKGTGLDGAALQPLEQLSTRRRQELGLIDEDLGSLTAAAAKLAVQMNATAEQSRGALGDLAKLLSGTMVTGEQAAKLAQAYPQLAGAIAKAFDVPIEKVLDLNNQTQRTSAILAQAVVEVGKMTPQTLTLSTAFGDLGTAIGDAVRRLDSFIGLSDSLKTFLSTSAREVSALTSFFGGLASAASDAALKTREAIAAAPAAQGMTPGMARRATAASGGSGLMDGPVGPFDPRDIQGPPIPGDLVAVVPPEALSPIERVITDSTTDQLKPLNDIQADVARSAGFGEKGLLATTNGFAKVYDAAQLGAGASKETAASTKAADFSNRTGLSAVERAIYSLGSLNGNGGGKTTYQVNGLSFDNLQDALNEQFRANHIGTESWKNDGKGGSTSNLPSLAGQGGQITSVLPENSSVRGSPGNYGLYFKQAGGTMADPATLAMLGWTAEQIAAGTKNVPSSSDSTSSMMGGVDDVISALERKQDNIMGRDWRPNAYETANPDIFYGNGKQFRESQDGAVAKLQEQIDNLTAIRTNGEKLPGELAKAMTAAMIAAGMTGEQIAAALAKTSSKSPSPTASAGPLTNRRAVGGNVVNWGLA